MMIEERVQVVAPILGQDGARSIPQKSVNHHPVVSGQFSKLEGRDI